MSNFANYPLIKSAIIEMAYDAGVINRTEAEEDVLTRMEELIQDEDGFDDDVLYQLEATLAELNSDDFHELVTGELDIVLERNADIEQQVQDASDVLGKMFTML